MNVVRCFDLAKRHLHKCKHKQYLVVALLIKKGQIISFGYNDQKTHPIMGATKRVHAEVRAILKAGRKDPKYATMFVFRSNKNGKIGMAKPCSICEALLRDKGIKNVFYTTSSGAIEELFYTYGMPG